MSKPATKPNCPNFSSGPCAKRPGWGLSVLENAFVGRSHRAGEGKKRLKAVIDQHKALLGIPEDYWVAIVPASDTGAVEMAMWTMLGARGVDALAWESFGSGWVTDIVKQLKLEDAKIHEVGYGEIVDFSKVDSKNRDVVFTWNGTTSGVRCANADWIADDREGITICDATSAVFAYDLPWSKLDVTTWSWQKVLGGEGAHGMLVLSPRALERLKTFTPANRPLPKIFRLAKKGEVPEGPFKGETINTPSMLAVEDCLDALKWVEKIGGVKATIKRCDDNYQALKNWADKCEWIEFLCPVEDIRSKTSVCFKICDDRVAALDNDAQMAFVKSMTKKLEAEGAANDIASYRDAPPGLRIWAGATVEASDLEALGPWLDWAFAETIASDLQKAA